MPTYEYICDACGQGFERFQSITAAPIRKCPSCGRSKARRLIGTGAGLIFKGSGFYITDYRSESYKNAAKNDGGASRTDTPAKDGNGKPAGSQAAATPASASTTSAKKSATK